MASTRQLDQTITPCRRLHDRPGRRIVCQSRIAYGIGESQQIVRARLLLLFDHEPDHFPTARS